jgi:hypothetical protein
MKLKQRRNGGGRRNGVGRRCPEEEGGEVQEDGEGVMPVGVRPERRNTRVCRNAHISTSSLTTRATPGTPGACTGTSRDLGMGIPGPKPGPLRAGEEDRSRRRTSSTTTWGRAAAVAAVAAM